MIRTITATSTMNPQTLDQLRAEGRTPAEIDAIHAAAEALERRNEAAVERRQQFARAEALESEKWERQRRWQLEQDAMASAQSRRANR